MVDWNEWLGKLDGWGDRSEAFFKTVGKFIPHIVIFCLGVYGIYIFAKMFLA